MSRKVLIVGAAVVAAIVLLLVLRRKANAAGMAGTGVGAPMTPQAALATLTTTPPRELAAAGLALGADYVAGQIRGDGQAVIPQNTARAPDLVVAYADLPFVGKYFQPAAEQIKSINYHAAAGYYG